MICSMKPKMILSHTDLHIIQSKVDGICPSEQWEESALLKLVAKHRCVRLPARTDCETSTCVAQRNSQCSLMSVVKKQVTK